MYSNAQKLARVLTSWSRPAISQIASSKLANLPMMRNAEQWLKGAGLVGNSYHITTDIMPFVANSSDMIIEPFVLKMLSSFPDESLPQMAHAIVDTALQQPRFSILDGLVEFEPDDLTELKDLLNKNLPLNEEEKYQIER